MKQWTSHNRHDEGVNRPGKAFYSAIKKAFAEKGDFEVHADGGLVTLTTEKGTVLTLVTHQVDVPRPEPLMGWSPSPEGSFLHLYDPKRPYREGTNLNPLCRPKDVYRGTLHHARCVNEARKKDLTWRRRCKTCEKKAIKLGIKLEGRPSR